MTMSTETEAKLRVKTHDPVRKRLQQAGATPLGCVVETNRIFDRPDGSLRGRGCGLRVRSTIAEDSGGRAATLTFKGPVQPGEFKSREELEASVDDAETTTGILEGLGFEVILTYQKRRESWQFLDCRIELDEPPHVGLFVEIEGPDEAVIRSVRDELGLGSASLERSSYVRMLFAYCRENGIADRTLKLPDSSVTPESTSGAGAGC